MKKIILILGMLCQYIFCYSQNIPATISYSSPIYNIIPGTHTIVPLPTAYNSGANPNPTLFNYVRTFIPQLPLTNASAINESTNTDHVKQSTVYTDGIGRTLQVVKRHEANGINSIVQPYDYRPSITKFAFLPYSASSSGFQKTAFSDQNNFYNGIYTSEQGTAASKETYTYNTSTGIRQTTSFAPGKSNIGQSRGTGFTNDINSSSSAVKIININPTTQLPQMVGTYSANQLLVKTTFNADGSLAHEFTDKEGKTILKRVLTKYLSGTAVYGGGYLCPIVFPSGKTPLYLETYYVYDEFGRHRYTISPKAYNLLNTTLAWTFSQTFVDNLCDYQNYDEKGRVIEKHKAGEKGKTYLVYDKHDRVLATKSPQEIAWKFSLYDKHDRVTVTGTSTLYSNRATWQTNVDNGNPFAYNTGNLEYYFLNEGAQGLYPTTLSNCEILSYTYYDSYNTTYPLFTSPGTPYDGNEFTGNLVSNSFSVVPTKSNRTRGYVTGRSVKVIKPYSSYSDASLLTWINTVYYYDEYGRIIQERTINHRSGYSITSTQYDFKGRVLKRIYKQTNPVCTNKTSATVIKTEYSYSPKTMLLNRVSQQIDNSAVRDLATYSYNVLGQIAHKDIGGTIESQTYDYNIRGQLTGINSNYTENSTTASGSITFGETIKYDRGFTNLYYNGKISGILWRGPGTSPLKAYGYTYDNSGRLIQSDYRDYTEPYHPSGTPTGFLALKWSKVNSDYTEGNIEYDYNGNISKLKRYGPTNSGGSIMPGILDDLTLDYENGGASNSVDAVTDAIPIAGQITDYDFKDNNISGTNKYEYDDNGNLRSDDYKGVAIINNSYLNKPSYIDFANGDRISYVYDASGNKLAEIYTGTKNEKNDFIENFTYTNNALLRIDNEEGYTRYNNPSFAYYFYVKDHLGNIRNVLDANTWNYGDITQAPTGTIKQYLATFEPNNSGSELQVFGQIDNVRMQKPLSTIPTDVFSAELDATNPTKRVGALLMIKVMAGDSFTVSADCYRNVPVTGGQQTVPPNNMMDAIISGLSGPGGIPMGAEGGTVQMFQQAFNPSNYMDIYEGIKSANTVPNQPKSYLNYLLFDEDMKMVKEESGVLQAGITEGVWGTVTNSIGSPVTINRSGYLIVYLSNEDLTGKQYWDNVTLYHHKGTLVEENHYYPYGVTVNLSNSNPLKNRNLFSGNKLDKTNGLELYDFHARTYNPQLGRFNAIDPMNEFHSGYVYCGGDPVAKADKTGESSYWSYFPSSSPMSVGMSAFYRGAGISGGGAVGFSLSREQIQQGYNALARSSSFVLLNTMGTIVGGGITSGGRALTSGEAAYISEGTAQGLTNAELAQAARIGATPGEYAAMKNATSQGFSISNVSRYGSAVNEVTYGSSYGIGVEAGATRVSLANQISESVSKLSITSPLSNRALWSGANTEINAIGSGFQTLSQTRAGQNLINLTQGMDYYPGSQSYNWWAKMSSTYVKGIPNGSTVNVFLNNPSPTSIYLNIEKPLLIQKNIHIIEHFIKW